MATAEPGSASLGPRYAPDDPTLPKPWMGLIDGSTGLMYYWNPETNITQYEKPATLPPPLPPGPPPASSTSKLTPLPVAQTSQPNGMLAQQIQQMTPNPQQQGQPMSQSSQQHGQLMAHQQVPHQHGAQIGQPGQQQGSQGQAMQPQGQQTPAQQQFSQHLVQHPGQHMPQQPGQQVPHQGIQQMPQHLGLQAPQHQASPMGQSGHQYGHQLQFMAYQQTMLPQGQQNSHQQTQHIAQAQPFLNKQEFKVGYPKREDTDYQQGNQFGFSPSQIQQTGTPYAQNLPAGTNSSQMGAQSGQGQQFGGSSVSIQQPAPLVQLQQTGTDLVHQQHGPRFQNQMGPAMVHGQQSIAPPVGLKMGYEENSRGRGGNDFHFNANKDGPNLVPQHPKLASIPMARNQQEMRMDGHGLPLQNVTPGHASGLSSGAGQAMHKMYNHASGGPTFPNNALMKPPMILGSSDVSNLSAADAYRQQHEVTASGDDVPAPFMTFESTGFPPQILREIQLAGFSSPTPIQAQTWPIAIRGRDIVAIAKTGSGKTLGYLIPIFIVLSQRRNNPQNGPTVLVLAPTRELATQIQDEAIKFGRSSRFSCTCLYGGAPKGPQLKELDRGADIVVATPGRLNDILEMKKIDFGQVSLLVLDEADRMLDMGFEPQIRKIVNEIPPRRQTLMFTATWPKEVRKIANDLLINPVQVNIGNVDELAANKSITQYVEVVPQMEKQRRLEQILRAEERGSKVIIFCSTKRLCDQLARSIGRSFGAAAIHGDKSQGERDWVLNQFRSGKSPILVATDVAARGLDVKDIRVVINYDFPTGVEDYVHRIGRTGRAGATGVAYTFFSDQDSKHVVDLIKVLEGANQRVPPEVREMALRGPGFGKDRGGGNRFDSGGGDGGRWDSGGRGGMRDGGFGGRGGGMRDGGLLSLLAPFNFNWPAFCTAVALYVATGLFGITLSFHRNLSHRSFKLPKWLEYLFAYCGVQALQGDPIDWVSTHRYHHQFCDSERDPHSPFEGFWFSHMNWMFDANAVVERCGKPNNVGDLKKQPFYRLIAKTYILHPIALGTLLYAIGGLPFVVWGMGVRIAWVYHITWLVNSACHVWGKQAWNTGDLSRNNWWVALLAFGEGWHNNHHAFEFSARHGLEWWQLDMTWYVIRFLQAVGLATDVKLPNEVQKQNMSFKDVSIAN